MYALVWELRLGCLVPQLPLEECYWSGAHLVGNVHLWKDVWALFAWELSRGNFRSETLTSKSLVGHFS